MTAITSNARTQHARRLAGVIAACLVASLSLAPSFARAQAEPAAAGPAPSAPGPATAAAAPAKSARVIEARARPARAYYYGAKQVSFAIKLAAKGPTDLRIDVVRNGSGAIERTINVANVAPKQRTTVPWDGLSGSGVAVRGKLRFVVRAAAGTQIPFAKRYASKSKGKGKSKRRGPKLRFGLFDHIFPVRGKHSYGDGLGAGRGHQGQDVSAPCGTKLVAAQGGTIQVNAFQASGAGYYLVIDSVGSDIDHVYMHLVGPPALPVGTAVMTGQVIGQVGTTGGSTGCHLHFEMWSGPGWYEGGSFVDPAPSLRAWDAYS